MDEASAFDATLNPIRPGLCKLLSTPRLHNFGLYKLKNSGFYKQKTECRQQRPLRRFAVNWDEMDEASAKAEKANWGSVIIMLVKVI